MMEVMNPRVGVIMGSKSDLAVLQEAANALEEIGIPFELKVVSAHRTPEAMFEYARTARERGLEVIIAEREERPTCPEWWRL